MVDQSKRNMVITNPDRPIAEMTREEFHREVAVPLADELIAQRDVARRNETSRPRPSVARRTQGGDPAPELSQTRHR